MSQIGKLENEIFGSKSKLKFESYTENELNSDEFFWNQLKIIVEMKNKEYFYHFMNSLHNHIEDKSGM